MANLGCMCYTNGLLITIKSITHNIRSLRASATAYFSFLPIPFPLGERSNACDSLTNSSCPVQAGEELEYSLHFYIEPFFLVGTSVNVEFNIFDEDTNQSVACIRLPIRVDPPQNGAAHTLE